MRERFSVVMERMTLELQGVPCITLEDAVPDNLGAHFAFPDINFSSVRAANHSLKSCGQPSAAD